MAIASTIAFFELRTSELYSRIAHRCFDPEALLESCYIYYYRDLAKERGSGVALETLDARKRYDGKLAASCHEAMHEIGRASFRETGSIKAAYAKADYSCWGGYLHDAVEASLPETELDRIASTTVREMCDGTDENGPRSFERFSCVHGVGHALMLVSENDLPGSLERCRDLGDEWEGIQCANGAFMQNMFAKYNEHDTDYLPTDDLRFPCDISPVEYQVACYQVQARLILDATEWDFDRSFAFCSTLDSDANRFACADGIGAIVSNRTRYVPKEIHALCERAGALADACLYGALTDLEGISGSLALGRETCGFANGASSTECLSMLDRAHRDFPGDINERSGDDLAR